MRSSSGLFDKLLLFGLYFRSELINVEQDEIIIQGPLLSRAIRRQLRRWAWLGPMLTLLLLALALCLLHTSYTTSVSIAMQQSSPIGASPLAMLAGAGGQSKLYLGVLKSRQAAESVERHVHLNQLYGISDDAAVKMLMKSVKPDETAADGLLYISVTLGGSPRLSLHHSPDTAQIKVAAAQAANAYALALKEYYATSGTDQASVLLRGADTEQRRARADYDAALTQLLEFSRGLKRVDPRSAPSSSSDTSDVSTAASGLSALYASQAQIQAELSAAIASRKTLDTGVTTQLKNLPNVPTDDSLLSNARTQVAQDQAAFDTASRLYGPENPRVIRAQTQLSVDEAQLNRQIQGVKSNLTTPDLRINQQIQGLYARQAVVFTQIGRAERQLGIHRELSGEFGRLQTEVAIRLEVLKATLGEAAKIRLDNSYAQNRMSVIDEALPPTGSDSGILRLLLICLIPPLLLFLLAVTRQYLREVSASAAAQHSGQSANGAGPKVSAYSEDEARRAGKQ